MDSAQPELNESPIVEGPAMESGESNGNRPPEWLIDFLIWVGRNPWEFVTTLFLILSPLFLATGYLAWRLSKMIAKKEQEEKKAQKRNKSIKKMRRMKAD